MKDHQRAAMASIDDALEEPTAKPKVVRPRSRGVWKANFGKSDERLADHSVIAKHRYGIAKFASTREPRELMIVNCNTKTAGPQRTNPRVPENDPLGAAPLRT